MKRVLIPLVCLLVALHHLVVEGLYLLPVNPLTSFYSGYVERYMNPLFQQRWQLFAPEPVLYSLQLWYRCGDGEKSTEWFDPAALLLNAHHRYRVTGKGKVSDLYQGLAREYLNTSIREFEACNKDKSKSVKRCEIEAKRTAQQSEYGMAAQKGALLECHKFVESGMLHHVAWIQFQSVKVYPKQYSERHSDKMASRIEYYQSDKIMAEKSAQLVSQ